MPDIDTLLVLNLPKQVRKLELRLATPRLLAHLFQAGGVDATPGRYHLLEQVIEESPKFLRALLDNSTEAIQYEWTQALKKHQSDVHFLHFLAVVYWEAALAGLTEQADVEHYWLFSTTLWGLLLSSNAFWQYFAEARLTQTKGEERQSLTAEQMDTLLRNALGDILALHRTEGSRNFEHGLHAPDRNTQQRLHDRARVHLQCINLCCAGEKALITTIKGYGMSWTVRPDKRRLEMLTNQAKRVLDNWSATLVEEAEKATKNSEDMKRLPQGIRMYYQGGIERLEVFIKLNIPVIRVLTTCLDWYNDWCYDLYVTGNIERIKELMQPARTMAEQLIPLCVKLQDHRQENRALSQHFLLRGFTADDPKDAIKEYEEAIEWNSTNTNAKQLSGDSREAILRKQLNIAIECAERQQFEEAYQALSNIEREVAEQAQTNGEREAKEMALVREARSGVCFHHAHMLANDSMFNAALERAREAQRLNTKEPIIQEFVKTLRELAPEEENLRYMRSANEAYERDLYDQAIQSVSHVPVGSRFYQQARHLQSAAYFHRGIEAANRRQDFDRAAIDLEQALALNDDRGQREIISRQLEVLQQARFGFEIKRAMEAKDFSRVERLLRGALANETTRKGRHEIQTQLSVVLNAHAVTIVNELQESEKQLGDALMEIVALVKQALPTASYGSFYGFDDPTCPLCKVSRVKQGPWGTKHGRGNMISVVVNEVKSSGRLAVNSPSRFWGRFEDDLCPACESKPGLIEMQKREALHLLEEAISFDSGNRAARENLAALKKIL